MKRITTLLVALSLVACGSNKPRPYTALGASITAGVGAGGVVDELDPLATINRENSYPYILAKTYGIRHANLGIPGAMADDIYRLEVIPALAIQPTVITLWTGGNDVIHRRDVMEFEYDLNAILARLGEFSEAKVYILNLPRMYEAPKFILEPDPDVTPERIEQFNEAIVRQSVTHGAVVVDISGAGLTANPKHFSEDGFHLSAEGHRFLVEAFVFAGITMP